MLEKIPGEYPNPDALKTTLAARLPEWWETWQTRPDQLPRRAVLLPGPCPYCREKTLYCISDDFGQGAPEMLYAHLCVNPECRYIIWDDYYGEPGNLKTDPNYCPWCRDRPRPE